MVGCILDAPRRGRRADRTTLRSGPERGIAVPGHPRRRGQRRQHGSGPGGRKRADQATLRALAEQVGWTVVAVKHALAGRLGVPPRHGGHLRRDERWRQYRHGREPGRPGRRSGHRNGSAAIRTTAFRTTSAARHHLPPGSVNRLVAALPRSKAATRAFTWWRSPTVRPEESRTRSQTLRRPRATCAPSSRKQGSEVRARGEAPCRSVPSESGES